MTIDIAYRLVELRRKNGLSQEELAEKLGLSRQAVSKWERAEASPDTDNLIALARLYGVSLDELVGNAAQPTETAAPAENGVHIGPDGIQVNTGQESVHVGWQDIHVEDRHGHAVHLGANGLHTEGGHTHRLHRRLRHLTPPLATVIYLVLGFGCGLWHPGWLVFLAIPVLESLLTAIRRKNPACFAYPMLVTVIYLLVGFTFGWWHPWWALYLTVPIYYAIFPHRESDPHPEGNEDEDED